MNLELAGENVIVAVFGMGEPAQQQGERLVAALRRALETRPRASTGARASRRPRRGVSWS